jgi:hypothetical protein
MPTLVNALNEGQKRGRIDACIVGLPGVPDHAYEYDGGYFHTEARVPNDVDKTRRMLQNADLLVLRVRVGAPSLPMEHTRLIVVHVDKSDDAVDAMSRAFAEHVADETVRSSLLCGRDDRKEVDNVAHDFFMWADRQYKTQFEIMTSRFDVDTARRILSVHGIKTHLAGGSVVRILDRLIGAPYNVKKLETFMCNSVAARFADEAGLFRILDRLMGAPYNVKKLETFMCGGVAARFADEAFLVAVSQLPVLNKSRAATLCRSFPLKRARVV